MLTGCARARRERSHRDPRLYITDRDGNETELYIDVPGVDWRNDTSLLRSPVMPLTL